VLGADPKAGAAVCNECARTVLSDKHDRHDNQNRERHNVQKEHGNGNYAGFPNVKRPVQQNMPDKATVAAEAEALPSTADQIG